MKIYRLSLAISFFMMGFIAFAHAVEKEPLQLWSVLGDAQYSQLGQRQGEINSVAISLNQILINQLAQGQKVQLPLLEKSLVAVVDSGTVTAGVQVWRLRIAASPNLPNALLFVSGSGVTGWFPTKDGNFRLRDGRLFREYHMGGKVPDYRIPKNFSPLAQKPAFVNSLSADAKLETVNLRVMFVVTNEFVSLYPNTAQTLTEYITVTNSIYEASGINFSIENAGVLQADLESFTMEQILDNISGSDNEDSTKGDIPTSTLGPIWDARLENRADFVAVMVANRPDGSCGLGWLNGNANQAFTYQLAVNVTVATTTFQGQFTEDCGIPTLGHELGHNMGLAHSLKQGEEGSVFTFGRGYGIEDRFTTVMAYPQEFGDALGVSVFSSPDLTCFNSFDCGVDRSQSDGADAVYALNEVKEEIALIFNDAVTKSLSSALAEVGDNGLSSCISESYPDARANFDVFFLSCYDYEINTLAGLDNFPNLGAIGISGSSDTDLNLFRNIRGLQQLDLRDTSPNTLRPIAYLQDQLSLLQFSVNNLSCQELNVAQSWDIETFNTGGNCTSLANDAEDFDGDGATNLVDTDDDNDGIDDISDGAPFDAGNANDIDNDGVEDANDAFPYDETESLDTDLDTVGNNRDTDDDNDGVLDADDCAPLDASQSTGCDNSGEETKFIAYDYDGDGKADVGVRRPSTFFQYINNSSGTDYGSDRGDSIQRVRFGSRDNDISISGDFDGDKIADIAVRRPSNQFFYILNSSDDEIQRFNFGRRSEDIPVPADYDGDGITDVAVRRNSNFTWYILNSSGSDFNSDRGDGIQRVVFGRNTTDIAVPADYDGDGKADVAVRRPSNGTWYIKNSSGGNFNSDREDGIQRIVFGSRESDIPVPADYDGDGKADVAVRRESNYTWYIKNSDGSNYNSDRGDGIQRIVFGRRDGDIPIVADYDGDGKADIAVRRPSNATQYILRSSDNEIERIRFGSLASDMPLAAPLATRMLVSIGGETALSRNDEGLAYQVERLTQEQARAEELID